MAMWCDTVKHRFRSGIKKHKAASLTGASDVNRSTCCLWKRAQSCQAVCLLKAQRDLIREKPKHCYHQQRKARKMTVKQ